jgi:hypothetical protein
VLRAAVKVESCSNQVEKQRSNLEPKNSNDCFNHTNENIAALAGIQELDLDASVLLLYVSAKQHALQSIASDTFVVMQIPANSEHCGEPSVISKTVTHFQLYLRGLELHASRTDL